MNDCKANLTRSVRPARRAKLTRVKPPGDLGDDPGQFASFGGDPMVFSPGGLFEPDKFIGDPVVLG